MSATNQVPVYILKRVPGAETVALTVEWTDVCHGGPFIYVWHQTMRSTGRWSCVERKRPFIVSYWSRGHFGHSSHERSSHKTLDAAIKAARKIATEKEATS